MSKLYGLMSIMLIVMHSEAGRIVLKDGTVIDVPNKISIFNDLSERAGIEEHVAYPSATSEARRVTLRELAIGQELHLEVNSGVPSRESTAFIGIMFLHQKYYLNYATSFHPDAESGPLEVYTAVRYKLSDIVAGKKDTNGLTLHTNT